MSCETVVYALPPRSAGLQIISVRCIKQYKGICDPLPKPHQIFFTFSLIFFSGPENKVF